MSAETLKALGMKDLSLFREQAYIAGNWSDADSSEKDKVLNPATGEVLGTVPRCGQQETRKAIEAANQAMPAWKATPAKERGKILRRWYELMIENKEDLAILTEELGESVLPGGNVIRPDFGRRKRRDLLFGNRN